MKKMRFLVAILFLGSLFGCAKIVFMSQRDGHDQIYMMKTDGSVQKNLSSNSFSERYPDASPDGKKIVFSSLRDGVGENIFVMDIEGGSIQKLTTGANRKIRPRWSPQQDRIAYAEYTSDEAARIFIMASGGGSVLQVTEPDQYHSDSLGHAFFDNGTKLVFARTGVGQGVSRLYYKNADGTGSATAVPNTLDKASYPVVSHNGFFLAYRVKGPNLMPGAPEYILVHEVESWRKVSEFQLQAPVPGMGPTIRGIAFSKDDTCLYVAARAADVAGGGNKRLEIFSVNLDGTDQKRLTDNTAPDLWPCAVPAP
jgi:Tol biopolymer transport system component